ncbi:hypothetical protein LTR37_020331 [Vermiconidia calcicola]|uniref:Uncharacterized protein n=1 Tax=Vermiconidia calcicola TaxID=1690605 RepID=A0ACC3MBJ7_9PEZI|nr:hypothetical protein LTR37_020331 [Vermiconidia calcicola]
MANLTPVVLENLNISEFIQHVLVAHSLPSTIIVCSSKDAFLKHLHAASARTTTLAQQGEEGEHDGPRSSGRKHEPWSVPTLRLLASSRTVRMVFCPDVTHLRACLGTHAHRPSEDSKHEVEESSSQRLLAVLNPIQLHRPTSAFSAQGLNRTFATAVEAAYRTKSRLVVGECSTENIGPSTVDPLAVEADPAASAAPPASQWDEHVSILNVTTKSFGVGERGWVGRTVKIRSIAERWCTFRNMVAAEN